MFNGNRVAFAKMFVKKKSATAKERNPNQLTMFDISPNPSLGAVKREFRRLAAADEDDQDEAGE